MAEGPRIPPCAFRGPALRRLQAHAALWHRLLSQTEDTRWPVWVSEWEGHPGSPIEAGLDWDRVDVLLRPGLAGPGRRWAEPGTLRYALGSPRAARRLLESIVHGAASQSVDMLILCLSNNGRLRVVREGGDRDQQRYAPGQRQRLWVSTLHGGTLRLLPNASVAHVVVVLGLLILAIVLVRWQAQ